MPTRKQRKRMQKERRHEYETVWVDSEGNDLEEPPDDAPARVSRDRNPAPRKGSRPRQSRATRTPLPPSWRRAAKRGLILGAAIFAFLALTARSKSGQHEYASAVFLAPLFTAIFTLYMYGIDRFIYRRWERKNGGVPDKR